MTILGLEFGVFRGSRAAASGRTSLMFERSLREDAPARFCRRGSHHLRTAYAVFSLVLISSLWCYSADMVLIRCSGASSSEQHELELATQFYGLNLRIVTLCGANNAHKLLDPAQLDQAVAIAIEANALSTVNQKVVLHTLRRKVGGGVPLLILGVAADTDPGLLGIWSGGATVGTKRLTGTGLHYLVGNVAGVTEQLSGLQITFPGNDAIYFASAEHSSAQQILSVTNGHQVVPVFIETGIDQQRVFLLCKRQPQPSRIDRISEDTETAFAEVASVMMFTKYCAGDRGWHATHHYANFTIDDPWLREPYGYLDYNHLLVQMEKHNFHTTIAFIPWNYDRSEPAVVALFRSHPERFSICVHGDNHDHKEFDTYASKSLSAQIAALGQSLARMEKFQALTGVPYDKVFVFPHNIGSEGILEQLKAYNFAATVNSLSVPMDRVRPASPLFPLRPVTLSFGDFPSVARFGAAFPNPTGFIGINAFLDNPIFFYGHHDLFASGIGAFDGLADDVNRIEPDTRWRSLGDMAKHLYLVRLRDDRAYDVLAFSSTLDLENTSRVKSVFYIQKPESDSSTIASVSVEDRPVPFQLNDGYLNLSVAIPAGESRRVLIRYKNDLDLPSVDISKSSPRVYLLRMVSDFRDITLSKYRAGRAVTKYYYKDEMSQMIVILCGCALIIFGLCGMFFLRLIMKRRKTVVLTRGICVRY
jgi:hypothetical protein